MSPSYSHQWSSRISLLPFRTFRGPLFPKPVTGQELFWAFSYSKLALDQFQQSRQQALWAYCPKSIQCLIGLGADHVIGVKVSVIDQVSPITPIISPFKVFNFILSNKKLESMSCWWCGIANIKSVPSPVVLKSKVIRASFPEVCALTFPPMYWGKKPKQYEILATFKEKVQ